MPAPVETSKAAATASHYFGKAVEAATSAATYVSEAASPYAATLSSKVAALQGAIAGKLPSVASAMGKEVTIIHELGPTTVGMIGAVTVAALPTVLPLLNYIGNSFSRSNEKADLLERNEAALTELLDEDCEDIDAARRKH